MLARNCCLGAAEEPLAPPSPFAVAVDMAARVAGGEMGEGSSERRGEEVERETVVSAECKRRLCPGGATSSLRRSRRDGALRVGEGTGGDQA